MVKLGDEWKADDGENKLFADDPLATSRPALIFVHGDLQWDRLVSLTLEQVYKI